MPPLPKLPTTIKHPYPLSDLCVLGVSNSRECGAKLNIPIPSRVPRLRPDRRRGFASFAALA